MKTKPEIIAVYFSMFLFGSAFAQTKTVDLKEIFLNMELYPREICCINWLGDDSGLLYLDDDTSQNSIHKLNFVTKEVEEYYSDEDFIYQGINLDIESFWINSPATYFLIRSEMRRIWRHSREGIYYLVNRATGDVSLLADGQLLRNVKFSPDGKQVAYILNNNLYCFNISAGKIRQLTKDGSENIINGQFGWVYEEEFGSADGYRWSPDSKSIAFWREDQTNVPRFRLIDELEKYPMINEIAYPKVGETNPTVKIGIVKVAKGKVRWMKINPGTEFYIPRIKWAGNSNELAVMRLNRPQNKMEVLLADAKTGAANVVIEDTDSCWVDVTDNWQFMGDGTILWTSEKSGYQHIYHYDRSGNQIRQITEGDWEVNRIVAVNEDQGIAYFTGKFDSVLEDHLYKIDLSGGGVERISTAGGSHSVKGHPDGKYFIDMLSSVATPPRISVIDNEGEIINTLVGSTAPGSDEYRFTYPEFIEVPTSDGLTTLNAMITLPPDFDPSQQYPVVIFGYGGPGSQRVMNRWGGHYYYFHQYLGQKGFITFSIDNRGTGGRGKAFENLAYGDLGKWLVNDQIEGVKYLRSLPYVKADKIGIWGHSGGGYMAALCLTKGSDYFQVGIARAPVTDFRLYDTIWTERYMGLIEDNAAGYDSASVFNYVDQLQGKLLLIHGTGDDNVHPQNSLQLADHFVKANKQVDMYFYANKNHGIRGPHTSYNLYQKMVEYFNVNLK